MKNLNGKLEFPIIKIKFKTNKSLKTNKLVNLFKILNNQNQSLNIIKI